MDRENNSDVLAAIDLGSNSFHMIIARLRDGHFQVVDKLREMVQLRAGLDSENRLTDEAKQRALECLKRFGERIRDLPTGSVRVVGTNTLRVAKNNWEFLRLARQALGRPIEIIAGKEEARLIYLGVAQTLAFDDSRRLVMDIGGGSTEFIIGEGVDGLKRESLEMGCVSFSQRFFPDGEITRTRMKTALIVAGTRLREIQRPYQNMGWSEAIGASGTIRTVANIIREKGWADDGIITPKAIGKLTKALIDAGHIDDLKLEGVSVERASVIAGGVVILKASFERLKIERMIVSDGALREGLLYDLLGRIQHDDERERTVSSLATRYRVDQAQADRVSAMAVQLFEQVAKEWKMDNEDYLQSLKWAANLHEIGLTISHEQFHKHSGYLVAESVLPGFSREEQRALAMIVLAQRKKFPKKELKQLPEELYKPTKRLAIILRLAMVFNRGRSEQVDTFVKLEVAKKSLQLSLPAGWLARHPLSEADLLQEAEYLKSIKIKLKIKEY